ncbi:MAG: hypothetical protein ICV78_00650 [Tolypothrix sp. Co-bin9]|nr:hypothetical protein [Tolypothrix sp. Co-bin9]
MVGCSGIYILGDRRQNFSYKFFEKTWFASGSRFPNAQWLMPNNNRNITGLCRMCNRFNIVNIKLIFGSVMP